MTGGGGDGLLGGFEHCDDALDELEQLLQLPSSSSESEDDDECDFEHPEHEWSDVTLAESSLLFSFFCGSGT